MSVDKEAKIVAIFCCFSFGGVFDGILDGCGRPINTGWDWGLVEKRGFWEKRVKRTVGFIFILSAVKLTVDKMKMRFLNFDLRFLIEGKTAGNCPKEGSPSPRPNGFPSPPRYGGPSVSNRFAVCGPAGRGGMSGIVFTVRWVGGVAIGISQSKKARAIAICRNISGVGRQLN